MVEAGLDDADRALGLLLEVGELSLQAAHATEHAVDGLEHFGARCGVEGGGIGCGGESAEEGVEVLLDGGRRLEVVLVGLLRLLVDPAERFERCLR